MFRTLQNFFFSDGASNQVKDELENVAAHTQHLDSKIHRPAADLSSPDPSDEHVSSFASPASLYSPVDSEDENDSQEAAAAAAAINSSSVIFANIEQDDPGEASSIEHFDDVSLADSEDEEADSEVQAIFSEADLSLPEFIRESDSAIHDDKNAGVDFNHQLSDDKGLLIKTLGLKQESAKIYYERCENFISQKIVGYEIALDDLNEALGKLTESFVYQDLKSANVREQEAIGKTDALIKTIKDKVHNLNSKLREIGVEKNQKMNEFDQLIELLNNRQDSFLESSAAQIANDTPPSLYDYFSFAASKAKEGFSSAIKTVAASSSLSLSSIVIGAGAVSFLAAAAGAGAVVFVTGELALVTLPNIAAGVVGVFGASAGVGAASASAATLGTAAISSKVLKGLASAVVPLGSIEDHRLNLEVKKQFKSESKQAKKINKASDDLVKNLNELSEFREHLLASVQNDAKTVLLILNKDADDISIREKKWLEYQAANYKKISDNALAMLVCNTVYLTQENVLNLKQKDFYNKLKKFADYLYDDYEYKLKLYCDVTKYILTLEAKECHAIGSSLPIEDIISEILGLAKNVGFNPLSFINKMNYTHMLPNGEIKFDELVRLIQKESYQRICGNQGIKNMALIDARDIFLSRNSDITESLKIYAKAGQVFSEAQMAEYLAVLAYSIAKPDNIFKAHSLDWINATAKIYDEKITISLAKGKANNTIGEILYPGDHEKQAELAYNVGRYIKTLELKPEFVFATDQDVLEWASLAGVDSVEFENNITQRPAQRKEALIQLDEAASPMSGADALTLLFSGFNDESDDRTEIVAVGASYPDDVKES